MFHEKDSYLFDCHGIYVCFCKYICPRDDYSYVGGLYTKTLAGIKAGTIILIGVAHKAKVFKLENKLVFDSFDEWKCAGGNIKVSALREKLLKTLSPTSFVVHDSIMQAEHSLEAITPFLSGCCLQTG